MGLLEPHGRHRGRDGEADLIEDSGPRRNDAPQSRGASEDDGSTERAAVRRDETAPELSAPSIDADVKGKRVLVRVDLNVPMENGRVTDATRIERVVPTITEIADKGGKVILLAHFGRPKGRDPKESPEAGRGGAVRAPRPPVAFAEDCIGEAAAKAVAAMKDGDVLSPREHPLPRRRGEERSGLREGAREARRPLGQRRLLGGAPRACLDRGPRPRAAGLCRPRHAGRARGAGPRAGGAGAPGHGGRRRRQGLDQDRPARKPRRQGRCPRDRRRHGQHLPARQGVGVGKSLAEKDLAATALRIMDKARETNCAIILPVDAVVAYRVHGERADHTYGIDAIPPTA